jgi:hypothetical protein
MGKVVSAQQVYNFMNRVADGKNVTESTVLLNKMCRDTSTIFLIRFQIVNRENESRGFLDLLRVPGIKFLVPVRYGQLYNACRDIGCFETPGLQDHPSIFERYSSMIHTEDVFNYSTYVTVLIAVGFGGVKLSQTYTKQK